MRKAVKIAIASSGLGHVARGIEAWAHDVAYSLAERGADVILCKGAGEAETEIEQVVPCWERASAKTQRAVRWLGKRFFWRFGLGSDYDIEQTTFARHLLKILRRRKIDILHVQDPQLALLIQRAGKLGLVKTKVILGHGTEESLEFLKKIDYLQHLAPWHLDEAKEAGVWKPAWTAIPNFIDTARFGGEASGSLREELGIPQEAIVVVTAAAIKRHHKRIDYLIEEFARLREAHPELPVWLVIAGGRERETDELIAIGNDRLGDRVRFQVRFPRERMADLYRSADIFVLCSLKEMMPIALLEATASGLPCLVNQHPVVDWMKGPGGEAIDMSAEGVLAGALFRLASDRAYREELGKLAREYCIDNFSRDRVVDQILEYYEYVLSHEKPNRANAVRGPRQNEVSASQ